MYSTKYHEAEIKIVKEFDSIIFEMFDSMADFYKVRIFEVDYKLLPNLSSLFEACKDAFENDEIEFQQTTEGISLIFTLTTKYLKEKITIPLQGYENQNMIDVLKREIKMLKSKINVLTCHRFIDKLDFREINRKGQPKTLIVNIGGSEQYEAVPDVITEFSKNKYITRIFAPIEQILYISNNFTFSKNTKNITLIIIVRICDETINIEPVKRAIKLFVDHSTKISFEKQGGYNSSRSEAFKYMNKKHDLSFIP